MKADLFYRTYNRNKRRMLSEKNVRHIRVTVPKTATLEEIIQAGLNAGMSKGNFISGCFEIQTNLGIWSRPDSRSMVNDCGKAIFKTWKQLEHEELEESNV